MAENRIRISTDLEKATGADYMTITNGSGEQEYQKVCDIHPGVASGPTLPTWVAATHCRGYEFIVINEHLHILETYISDGTGWVLSLENHPDPATSATLPAWSGVTYPVGAEYIVDDGAGTTTNYISDGVTGWIFVSCCKPDQKTTTGTTVPTWTTTDREGDIFIKQNIGGDTLEAYASDGSGWVLIANQSEITANTAKISYTDAVKVAGIETGADVTDTVNVTAAGALMDSEVTNLAQVKAFNSADYATAAQGTTADSALQSADINTLAELNVIVADATLIDTTDSRLSDARTPTAHTHTASEVTDFDTEVANNTAVALNTAKVSNIAHPLVETAVPVGALFTDTIYDDATAIRLVSSNYTAIATDEVIKCSGTFGVELPTAVGISGKEYVIILVSAGSITIIPDGTEKINGASSKTLSTIYSFIRVVSDNANWFIIGTS